MITTFKPFDDICDDPNWEIAPQTQVSCPNCLKTHFHNKYLAALFPNTPCEDCEGGQEAFIPPKVYLHPNTNIESIIAATIPPAYTTNHIAQLPQPQLRQILDFDPLNNSASGLYLTGPSRSGKTRCLAALIIKLIQSFPRFSIKPPLFIQANQLLPSQNSDFSQNSFLVHKRKLKTIYSHPLLAIDDLFNEHFNPSHEATLLQLFEHRISFNLPTLITSQFTLRQAYHKFSCPLRAHAVINRIKESTSTIPFNLNHKSHK